MQIAAVYDMAASRFQDILLNYTDSARGIIEAFARDQLQLNNDESTAFAESVMDSEQRYKFVTHQDINDLHLWYFINYIAVFVRPTNHFEPSTEAQP